MPRDEDGEFEVVLGNKQLLSVFLIVIVLLGVVFAMGYIIGRSSAPMQAAGRKPESEYVRSDAPSAMGGRASRTEIQPAPSETTASPEARPSVEGSKQGTPLAGLREPAAGQIFLQVASVAKPQADVLTQVLDKKGFRTTIAPGPSDELVRVLVGPARDTAETSRLKGALEQAGFKSFVKKY